jgi:alpha-beta hydrolase superfamily lysophospholipase
MKRPPLWLIALIITPIILIGIVNALAPEVSEEVAFQPQPRPQKAQTEQELGALFLANSKATNWKRPTQITEPGPGVTRLVSSDPDATFTPQDARHGFVQSKTDRIAWTLFTRVGKERDARRPFIVMCTGNAMDRYSAGVSYAQKGLPWGDVLLFDYPGYGDSTGKPQPATLENASDAIMAKARTLAGGRPLILWGHSLGGFVCGKMASKMPEARGLVLETTARRAKDVVRAWTPSWARPFIIPKISPSLAAYDNSTTVAGRKQRVPVLVLGAGQDATLPVELARDLAADLKQRGAVVTYREFPQALHWNVPKQPEFRSVMTNFFKSVESQP